MSKRRAAASQKADQARPQIDQHRKAAREAEARVVEIGEQLEQLSGIMSNYPNVGLYPFSALKGDGKEAILDAIQAHLS